MLTDFFVGTTGEEAAQGLPRQSLLARLTERRQHLALAAAALLLACGFLISPFFFTGQQTAIFLLLVAAIASGALLLAAAEKLYPASTEMEKMVAALPVSLASMLFIYVAHLVFPQVPARAALLTGSGFLLPFTITLLWPLYRAISEAGQTVWYYNDALPLQKSTTFLNSIPVQFRVVLPDGGQSGPVVAFKAPARMKMGLIFYHMAQEYSRQGGTAIHLTDDKKRPFGWMFYTKSLAGWFVHHDPEKSLVENNIRNNAVIYARRVDTDMTLS